MKRRICALPGCGANISHRAPHAQFCSIPCYNKSVAKQQCAERKAKRKYSECLICGVDISNCHARAVTCSRRKCRLKRKTIQQREYNTIHHPPSFVSCEICSHSFKARGKAKVCSPECHRISTNRKRAAMRNALAILKNPELAERLMRARQENQMKVWEALNLVPEKETIDA